MEEPQLYRIPSRKQVSNTKVVNPDPTDPELFTGTRNLRFGSGSGLLLNCHVRIRYSHIMDWIPNSAVKNIKSRKFENRGRNFLLPQSAGNNAARVKNAGSSLLRYPVPHLDPGSCPRYCRGKRHKSQLSHSFRHQNLRKSHRKITGTVARH